MIHLRWIVLFLNCTLLFGNYYAYDLPAALNVPLQHYLKVDDELYQYQINTLYAIYSLPNIFLPFLGGWLVDVLGTAKLTVILSAFVCLGQFFYALGVVQKSFIIMCFGRALFGIGGESLFVSQTRMTTTWFRGKELAFALGINLAMARMGSVLNDFLSPVLGIHYSIPTAMWFGFLTCVASFCCSVYLSIIDKKYDPHTGKLKSVAGNGFMELYSMEEDEDELFRQDPLAGSPDLARVSSLLSAQHSHGKLDVASFFKFPLSFWLICLSMNLMYATVIPFNTIHSAFLQTKWYKNDPQTASQVMAVPDTISAVLVPFCGSFVDKYGHRIKVLIVCGALMGVCHFILGVGTIDTVSSPMPCLVVLGFSYALLLTFWPCISLVVSDKSLATAIGIATASSNASLTLFPLIVAALTNADPTYYLTEMFFVACCILGILVCVGLYFLDRDYYGGILELPERKAESVVMHTREPSHHVD